MNVRAKFEVPSSSHRINFWWLPLSCILSAAQCGGAGSRGRPPCCSVSNSVSIRLVCEILRFEVFDELGLKCLLVPPNFVFLGGARGLSNLGRRLSRRFPNIVLTYFHRYPDLAHCTDI